MEVDSKLCLEMFEPDKTGPLLVRVDGEEFDLRNLWLFAKADPEGRLIVRKNGNGGFEVRFK